MVTIAEPAKRRRLTRNAIQCKKCQEILVSTYRHDFKGCKCGVFVDGGLDYERCGWPSGPFNEWITDLCEYAEEEAE